MRQFLLRLGLFFIPFFLFAGSFFVFDPFKVLYNHGEALFTENGTIDGFMLNRDYVSTELFMKKKDSLNYNSFIFGSSRSSVYSCLNWAKHIHTENIPFHFIGSGESLFGIWKKVKFLDNLDHPLRNALVIIDHQLLGRVDDGKGVIAIRHYKTSGNFLYFYFTHLKEYLSTDFFIQFIDYKFFRKKRRYMDKLFDNDVQGLKFDNTKNDWIFDEIETSLKTDSIGYYQGKKKIFDRKKFDKIISKSVIREEQLMMLNEMNEVFEKRKTIVKIVINPLYNQIPIHPSDLSKLKEIFGEKTVFDFSGKNDITNYTGNYYESSHYKPYIANRIMEIIYN